MKDQSAPALLQKWRGEEQGSNFSFSLLSEPISLSSLLFISSSRSIQLNSPYSQLFFSPSSLLFAPISPSSQLFLGHFSLLPILFLPPLCFMYFTDFSFKGKPGAREKCETEKGRASETTANWQEEERCKWEKERWLPRPRGYYGCGRYS